MKSWRRRPSVDTQCGQATVEFALSLVLLFAFVLFFVQLSLVFAWGNYIHYATFMSARAFLAGGDSKDDQVRRAENYAVRMLKRPTAPEQDRYPSISLGVADASQSQVPGLDLGDHPRYDARNKAQSWMEGVRYTFRSRIFMMPLAGKASAFSLRGDVNQLTLTSESWLGREPSYEDCVHYMSQEFGPTVGKDWVIDNGC